MGGMPHISGDTVAEHLARCLRLAAYLMPFLQAELGHLPGHELFGELLYTTLLFHDDDEIVAGHDIPSPLKQHNSKDEQEIEDLRRSLGVLTPTQQQYALKPFAEFRARQTVIAGVAKVIDRVTANQLIIEQKLCLVAPDSAKYALEYIRDPLVVHKSKTTDVLLEAQTRQIVDERNKIKNDEAFIVETARSISNDQRCSKTADQMTETIKRLLVIDLDSYSYHQEDIMKPLWEY